MEIPIKTKNKIIIGWINGKLPQEISLDERVSLQSVEEVLKEWETGFFNIPSINDIAPEIREIANMLKSKEISLNDLIHGYHYSEMFRGKDREKIIRISNELASMDENSKNSFMKTAEKMISFSKYAKIDYVEIPKALEQMVERGKILSKELRSKEIESIELSKRNDFLRREAEELEARIRVLRNQVEFAEYLRDTFKANDNETSNLKNVIEGIIHSGYDRNKIEDLFAETKSIRDKNLSIDQFLRLSKYLQEMMDLGLSVQTMEKILERLKEDDISVDEYLNERYAYVRDKAAYIKSVKDLVDVHKRLEKEIKLLDEEIARRKTRLEK